MTHLSADHTTSLYKAAVQLHQEGQIADAQAKYEEVLRADSQHSGALHLLGVVHQQQGQWPKAIELIEKAIQFNASQAIYFNNLGVSYLSAKNLAKARSAFEQALRIKPQYADAHANLGMVLSEYGEMATAEASLRRALKLSPRHLDALNNLANLLRNRGDKKEAIETYQAALSVNPRRPDIENNLGNLHLEEGTLHKAVEHYRRALAIDPGFAEAHLNLGDALGRMDQYHEARKEFSKASQLRPEQHWWRWRWLGYCPAVFRSAGEILDYRQQLQEGVEQCAEATRGQPLEDVIGEGFSPPFNLSHHALPNRVLKERYAKIFEHRFSCERPTRISGKPRIGFIATRGHEGSLLRAMSRLIRGLNRDEFEVVVFLAEGGVKAGRHRMGDEHVEWRVLPSRFDLAAEAIRAAKCDVLYYRQIGNDAMCYFLPMLRLAPFQCTSWGTHFTSGLSTIDAYISSNLIEISGADAHYTERLVRFHGLPACSYENPSQQVFTRSQFGLPESDTLYLVPQRAAKFHPDFDDWLKEILDRDPSGRIVLIQSTDKTATDRLLSRLKTTVGTASDRVLSITKLPSSHFLGLMSVCDVLLDIPHYNVSLMASDALNVGLPVVTLPGELKVQRYCQAYYRHIGYTELIANSREHYIQMALQLASDAEFWRNASEAILSRRDLLWDDQPMIAEHENFFHQAVNDCRQGLIP
ncbi:tetratricopeptide repeat protein [Bremerella sp. JC770]|uniref:tetratricopeptide repeat protein n=1 Tax=Bremerella sp. JC770 TaxID=3232137 RepID=UPI003459011B